MRGYGADEYSEPDGKGPEEAHGDPLAPDAADVGPPVEFEPGVGTVNGRGLAVTGPLGKVSGKELLKPADPTVPSVGNTDEAVEFERG